MGMAWRASPTRSAWEPKQRRRALSAQSSMFFFLASSSIFDPRLEARHGPEEVLGRLSAIIEDVAMAGVFLAVGLAEQRHRQLDEPVVLIVEDAPALDGLERTAVVDHLEDAGRSPTGRRCPP
eukprot:9482307-Pyramimonas_sp.AAC.1